MHRYDRLFSPGDANRPWADLACELTEVLSRFVSLFLTYEIPRSAYGCYPLRSESVSELRRNLAYDCQPSLRG